MGEPYKQANSAWNRVSQDKKLRQQQWDLETRRTDYLIDMQVAEEKGIKIGEEKGIKIGEEKGIKIGEERGEKKGIKIGEELGEKKGIKVGEERAEEKNRAHLASSVLRLCTDINLQLTIEEQSKIESLSFEKLIALQVYIASQNSLPKSFDDL